MVNQLVRITRRDDGEIVDNPVWCLVDPLCFGGYKNLCSQEFLGEGESNAEFDTKYRNRGGITCKDCLEHIRSIKAVRL